MSVSSQKNASAPVDVLGDLGGKLDTLPEDKFLAVVAQLQTLAALPNISRIIDEIRPRLRTLRPQRKPTLKRLFCNPFEDLLHDASSPLSKEPLRNSGRISRQAIEPCWQLLKKNTGSKLAALDAELKNKSCLTPEQILDIGTKLWALAANCLATALDYIPRDAVITEELATAYEVMKNVLLVAEMVESFKRIMPAKPILRLGEAESAVILSGCSSLEAEKLPCDGWLLVIAARLDSPGELLGLLEGANISIDKAMRHELSMVAAQSVGERAERFEQQADLSTPGDIAKNAESLMLSLSVTRAILDPQDQTEFDTRMSHVVGTVRKTVSARVVEPAAAMMSAIMTPDGSSPPKELLIFAEEQARALRRSRKVAGILGIESEVRNATTAVCKKFENHIDELLSHKGQNQSQETQAEVFRSIRMVELVDGPQQAQRLLGDARRRMR